MYAKACQHCKRLFNAIFNENLCPQCKEDLDNAYKEVKEFVSNNKGVNIIEVVNHFDNPFVTEKQIRKWLEEDKLQFAGEYTGLFCKKCGCMIPSGNMCVDCKVKLARELNNAFQKPKKIELKQSMKERERAKMRFL